jgi:hypothetical protein
LPHISIDQVQTQGKQAKNEDLDADNRGEVSREQWYEKKGQTKKNKDRTGETRAPV